MHSSTETHKPFIRENVNLGPLTSFKIGGPARYFAEPANAQELLWTVDFARRMDLPLRVIGGGTNVLISDGGVTAVVIRLTRGSFRSIAAMPDREGTFLVGSGVPLQSLVSHTTKNGFSGLEKMAGIPGTLGAAIRMNAGGKDGTVGDFVLWVEVLAEHGLRRIPSTEAGFGYRTSNFSGRLITSCMIALKRGNRDRIRSAKFRIVKDKRNTQPLSAKSAGCIFKNPPGDSAGRLIDASGLKKLRVGGASVSDLHANFIVNDASATSDDIVLLIKKIQKTVESKYGILLKLEVETWGIDIHAA